MASGRFAGLEEEFQHICRTLQTKTKQLGSLGGERKKLAIREGEREVEEGEDVLRQMTNVARSQPSLHSKTNAYRTDFERVKRDFKREVKSSSSQRDELFQGATDDWAVRNMDQRTHLLRDHGRLANTTDRLNNTTRVAHETEEIGVNILSNLDDQEASLMRGLNRLDDVDENLTRSRRILRAINRRVITNRLMLVCVAFLLFLGICLVAYVRWIGPAITTDPATASSSTTTTTAITTTLASTTMAPN